MNVDELLAEFLSHWPESYHPCDMERFVRWAIAAHREGRSFPLSAFEEHQMSRRAVDYYQQAFDVVGYTLEALR